VGVMNEPFTLPQPPPIQGGGFVFTGLSLN
jgi:hypothetical protein